jgi:hypothetical protein
MPITPKLTGRSGNDIFCMRLEGLMHVKEATSDALGEACRAPTLRIQPVR